MSEALAAVRVKHDTWRMTSDLEVISNAKPEDIIFDVADGNLRQAVASKLLHEDEPRLSRSVESAWNGEVLVKADFSYNGTDVDDLIDVLVGHPEVNVTGVHVTDQSLLTILKSDGLELGFVSTTTDRHSSHYQRYWYYKPADARRRAASRDYNRRRHGVSHTDVTTVIYQLRGITWRSIRVEDYGTQSWYCVSRALGQAVAVFNLLYGKDAHRRLEAFQELIRKWRSANPLTKKMLNANAQICREFIKWMDKEAKVKLPRPRKQQHWDNVKPLLRRPY